MRASVPPTVPHALTVSCTWDEVPHLNAAAKAALLADYPPHMRDARSKGVPMLGSGMIYPVDEAVWLVDDAVQMEAWGVWPPRAWPRAYGLDVGWNRTAAVWGAYDAPNDTVWLYAEHYVGEAPPSVHADAIRARGAWVPGAIDPASAGASQLDGKRLMDEYRDLGLDLVPAENAVEAGLAATWRRLASGRLKVMRSLVNWRAEQRLYARDEKGKVHKVRDHLMDATRYLVMSGMARGAVAPDAARWGGADAAEEWSHERSKATGY